MRRLLPVLFLPFVALLVAADPPKAKPPGQGSSYAFLVGCAGYNKAELQPIKDDVTINDVVEFKKALLATGFDDEHIKLLHDRQAEKGGAGTRYLPEHAKIVKELDLLLDGLTADDTVVVVLSGHGVHFKGDKAGYFCPTDAKVSTKQNLLPMDGDDGLYTRLEKCKAGRKLLVANACRNDPTAGASLAGGKIELVDDYSEKVPAGIAAIYSCDVGQKSYYDADRKRSLFFLHFTDAWKTGAMLEDVFTAATKKTKTDADKTFEAKQYPVVKRKYDGEWLLAGGAVGSKDRKGGEEVEFEIADGVKMTFCWIPPGTAMLGSPATEKDHSDDEKEHEYKSKGYWLGKYTVTQEQWTAVMGTTPFYFHAKGDGKDSVKKVDTGRFPAESVSWDDAQDFLKAVNKRPGIVKVFGGAGNFKLPHEDEWEYACRGNKGNKQPFYWGDTLNGDMANCDGNYPYGTTTKGEYKKRPTEVGSYAREAPHPWGLCDMAGNVWQWCDHYYDSGQKYPVLRGGSWCSTARHLLFVYHCRSADRYRFEPTGRGNFIGFRLCFPLDK